MKNINIKYIKSNTDTHRDDYTEYEISLDGVKIGIVNGQEMPDEEFGLHDPDWIEIVPGHEEFCMDHFDSLVQLVGLWVRLQHKKAA
jgi:hypothetical protein